MSRAGATFASMALRGQLPAPRGALLSLRLTEALPRVIGPKLLHSGEPQLARERQCRELGQVHLAPGRSVVGWLIGSHTGFYGSQPPLATIASATARMLNSRGTRSV